MAWFAVNKDGIEMVFNEKPDRTPEDLAQIYDKVKYKFVYKHEPTQWSHFEILNMSDYIYYGVALPTGSIEKITGCKISWINEPIEII